MTVVLEGLNQTVIDTCTTTTNNTADGIDTVDFKEGTASVYATLRASGNNDMTFTPVASVDMSGTKHLRFWGLFGQGSLINVAASGGIQVGISDGVNTGFYYLAGKDTYAGGWGSFVVNVAEDVDSGTKPTAMDTITSVIVRINLTAQAKNMDNTWVDLVQLCDGLYAHGDSGTGNAPFDFADIQAVEDVPSTGGLGITRRVGGVTFVIGAVYVGDDSTSASDAYFESTNEIVIVEDVRLSSTLCEIKPIGYSTGQVIEFALGVKSGSAGIAGTFVGTADSTQAAKWSIDGTNTYVDELFLMGSTFSDGTVTLPNNSTIAEAEVLNCSFIGCGPTDVNICNIKNCNFISADDVGALIQSTSHNLSYCNFIDCDHGIDFDTAGTYSISNCYFTTSTGQYDIEFSDPTTGSDLIINATKGDPSTYEITGNGDTVTINNTVILLISVVDNVGDPIAGARVYMTTDDTAAIEIFNDLTDTGGEVTDTGYNYSGSEDITGWVRKGSTTPFYETAPISGTITDNGLDLTIQLNSDQ